MYSRGPFTIFVPHGDYVENYSVCLFIFYLKKNNFLKKKKPEVGSCTSLIFVITYWLNIRVASWYRNAQLNLFLGWFNNQSGNVNSTEIQNLTTLNCFIYELILESFEMYSVMLITYPHLLNKTLFG